jgi:hypothetical protein
MGALYFCQNEQRKAQVRAALDASHHPFLNGIDYVEVITPDQRALAIHFLFPLPGTAGGVPANPALTAKDLAIDGGVRISGIQILSINASANILTVVVDQAGDFSDYAFRLIGPPQGFDPRLAEVDFSFKAECPSEFDCEPQTICPPPSLPTAEINYLAKDYASFRQLLLDRMSVTIPDWRERSPADLGIALVELLAYAGDQLSYYQEAVATEAYLGTARRRISIRRHAKLLDYNMHEGCNARTWVFFQASAMILVPQSTPLLTRGPRARGPINADQAQEAQSLGSLVFETMEAITVQPELNQLDFYTWSDNQCCLPAGATQATLVDNGAGALLAAGSLLWFEEVIGPATGVAADADPLRRHVVRLTQLVPGVDPLNNTKVIDIAWSDDDALPFPLCLSAVIEDQGQKAVTGVSVARGNLVLADHGQTVAAESLPDVVTSPQPYRPVLSLRGITFRVPYVSQDAATRPAFGVLLQDPHQALAAITLIQDGGTWTIQPDLLSSGREALDFVVEVEEDGSATLRFGDGVLGAEPLGTLQAVYRIGSGSAGNVGAEAIAHILATPAQPFTAIVDVRNPLAAIGGIDPEQIERVRDAAPWMFRVQERAVTAQDCIDVAMRHPEVKQARAALRWTGSWYTIFLTADRKGGKPVDAAFRDRIRNFLEQFRLAGYDLEIQPPKFTPLDIAMSVCVSAGFYRSAVKSALLDAFSNRVLADGSLGFFHPDRYTFGTTVYLSQVVATAMRVPGVAWVDTGDLPPRPNHFKRWGEVSHGETALGRIDMDNAEIARLDNDRNHPENGKIDFFMEGGL